MPTRNRTRWRPDVDGQFVRQLGRKLGASGKAVQHKFRLGTDHAEARKRDELLRQVWKQVEVASPQSPLWNDDTLELAKSVARGETTLRIPRRPDEDVVVYAQRVHELRKTFTMLNILPDGAYDAVFGVQLLGALDTMYKESEDAHITQRSENEQWFLRLLSRSDAGPGPTLHETMNQHITWIEQEYQHPEMGVTPWGRKRMGQVKSLISHHKDMALASLDRRAVEEMIQHWRQRPKKMNADHRITKKSAENYITALKGFFDWLHTAPQYKWREPEDMGRINIRVVTLESDRRTQITPEELFTLDELTLLYKYGTPLDRLLILLGLNCGFGRAESASLLVGEVHLRTAHSERHQEIMNFESTPADSFIKRVRRKSGVYGEFLVFDQTVQGIEWALDNRKKQAGHGRGARLLVNGKGEPYDKPTKRGNANQQIPNMFVRLFKRIEDNRIKIKRRPFKILRKTAGDLVKRFSDGEVKGVFLCHGEPVRSDHLDDAYTTRPFGKVFRALRDVEAYLQPMFAAAGQSPFRTQLQGYTPRGVFDRERELWRKGVSAPEIATEVGVSVATVYRHIERFKKEPTEK